MNIIINSKIVDEYLRLLCCKNTCDGCEYYDNKMDTCKEWINIEVVRNKIEIVLSQYLR